MALGPDLRRELLEILGPGGLLDDEAARHVYARDASHLTLGLPGAVALPSDAFSLQRVVAACARHEAPVVCRGTGTGLSGGAVPHDGAVVLSTGRMTRLDPVDQRGHQVHAEPGVLNEQVTRHAAPDGFHFAPDPSSQAAASIGGNIAENAGGPHCLRLGVTRRHVKRLDWVDASGRSWTTGAGTAVERGLDLASLLCGSEGVLGVVTGADLALVPDPDAVATLLAFFPDLDDATGAVVDLLGQGLLPVAVEMVDQAMLKAVEEAFGFGFPTDVAAAMIVEFAGPTEEVEEDADRALSFLQGAGAREVRRAVDAAERLELWKCRKKAFGAVGRLAPSYVTMDVVVPLGQLPGLVREIQVIKDRHQVEVATAFHAGDGNLHPGVHYDDRDPDESRRAHRAADEIIRAALDRGGSSTGEHGVGIEKLHVLPWQLDAETARLLHGIKDLFDPAGILNPGKGLPDPKAAFAPMPSAPLETQFHWDDLTVTAPSFVPVADLQAAALQRGFQIPVGFNLATSQPGPTVRTLVDHLVTGPALAPAGTARDGLLEIWAETGDGRPFHAGAPVFKNVAGFDLVGLQAGAGGSLATVQAATFMLRPAPRDLGWWRIDPGPDLALETLDTFLDFLGRRDTSLGGPTVIYETDGTHLTGPIHLLVPGRDRPWDLQALPSVVRKSLGGEVAAGIVKPFLEYENLLDQADLPEWSRRATSWTLMAPRSGVSDRLAAPVAGQFVWQAAPRILWAAGTVPPCEGWRAEEFAEEPSLRPATPNTPGLPVELLQGLKNLFDPTGNLPGLAPLAMGGADD